MPRLPCTISLIRRGGTPIDTASLFCVIPKPSMKSSIRISPGWIGSIRPRSVVVDEFDIVRTSLSPHEAKPPLRIDADAVLPLHHPVDAPDVLLTPDAFSILAAERSDHETSV